MDIFVLILLKLIVLDRLCGGLPVKVLEHLLVNYTLALVWWSASGILGGVWYVASLPFTRNKKDPVAGSGKEYKMELVEDGDWELISIKHSLAG